jgi:hypothetical protein
VIATIKNSQAEPSLAANLSTPLRGCLETILQLFVDKNFERNNENW